MSQQDVELVRALLAPFEQMGDIIPMWRDDAIFAAGLAAAGLEIDA